MRSLALTFRMAVGVAAVVMAIAGPAVADQEDNVPARPPRHVHHHAHPRTVPADGAARHAIGGAEAYGLGLAGGTALAVAGLAVHRRRRPVGTASG